MNLNNKNLIIINLFIKDYEFINNIFQNIINNKFKIFQDVDKIQIMAFEQFKDTFLNNSYIEFYLEKNNSFIKITIDKNVIFFIIPLEPLIYKKYDSEKVIDLKLYTEYALQICNNFAIYQLKADLNGVSIKDLEE